MNLLQKILCGFCFLLYHDFYASIYRPSALKKFNNPLDKSLVIDKNSSKTTFEENKDVSGKSENNRRSSSRNLEIPEPVKADEARGRSTSPTARSSEEQNQQVIGARARSLSQEKKDGITIETLEKNAEPIKSYSIIDAAQVIKNSPLGRKENGVFLKYNDLIMTEPMDKYVDALKNKYSNLQKISDIFPSYELKFAELDGRKSPEEVINIEVASDWKKPKRAEFYLENFYMGLKYFNDPVYKPQFFDSGFHFEVPQEKMKEYVDAIRPLYKHIPDSMLKMCIEIFLENQFEVKKVIKDRQIGKYDILDDTKPISTTPQELVNFLKNPELPIERTDLVTKDLTNLQKFYLMMDAVEGINKKENPKYLSDYSSDGSQIKDVGIPERVATTQSAGSTQRPFRTEGLEIKTLQADDFISEFGIEPRNLKNPTLSEMAQAQLKLRGNYKSYENFIKDKNNPEKFQALQKDYKNLNESLIAAAKEYKEKYHEDLNQSELVLIIDPQDSQQKMQNLIKYALDFSKEMNKAIVDKKALDLINESLRPSLQSKSTFEARLKESLAENRSVDSSHIEIEQVLLKQKKDVQDSINDFINQVKEKKLALEQNQISKLDSLDKVALEDLIRTAQDNVKITKKIYDELPLLEKLNFENQNVKDFKQAQIILDQFMQTHQQALNITHTILSKHMIEASKFEYNLILEDVKKDLISKKPENYKKVDQLIDAWLTENQLKEFEKQDFDQLIGAITTELKKEPQSELLQKYQDVFVQINTEIKPEQKKVQDALDQKQKDKDFKKKLTTYALELVLPENPSLAQIQAKYNEIKNQLEVWETKTLSEDEVREFVDEHMKDFVQEIKNQEDLMKAYRNILQTLEVKKSKAEKQTPSYKAIENAQQARQNIQQGEFKSAVKNAATSTKNAAYVVNDYTFKPLWDNVFAPVWNLLPKEAQIAIQGLIAVYIVTLGAMLIAIENSDLSREEKNKLHVASVKAAWMDVTNKAIADQTGASQSTVASGDYQAIAMEAALNKAIRELDPDDTTGYTYNRSVNSPGYEDNLTRLKREHATVFKDEYAQSY